MPGGYFDYDQYRIYQIAESVEQLIFLMMILLLTNMVKRKVIIFQKKQLKNLK